MRIKVRDLSGKILFDQKVAKDILTLGRSLPADIVVPHRILSRQHLQLSIQGSRVAVRDLESANGTFYDENLIKEVDLEAPCKLRLGKELWLEIVPDSESSDLKLDADFLSPQLTLKISLFTLIVTALCSILIGKSLNFTLINSMAFILSNVLCWGISFLISLPGKFLRQRNYFPQLSFALAALLSFTHLHREILVYYQFILSYGMVIKLISFAIRFVLFFAIFYFLFLGLAKTKNYKKVGAFALLFTLIVAKYQIVPLTFLTVQDAKQRFFEEQEFPFLESITGPPVTPVELSRMISKEKQ